MESDLGNEDRYSTSKSFFAKPNKWIFTMNYNGFILISVVKIEYGNLKI